MGTLSTGSRYPKKDTRVLQRSKVERFACIEKYSSYLPVSRLCRLYGVQRSGYYAWLNRIPSLREQMNQKILSRALELADQCRGVYGYRKLWHALLCEGFCCGKNRLCRLLRRVGYKAQLAVRKARYCLEGGLMPQPNLLNREFNPSQINRVWVSDITQVACREGWLYVSVVMDLHNREIVGFECSRQVTADIVLKSLQKSWNKAKPEVTHKLLFHSDQGSQYRSERVMSWLTKRGVTISMSRQGNCWDNACAESFFSLLKKECTRKLGLITCSEMAREIGLYISRFYNTIRSHSALGYESPVGFRS
ncbi:IS3 family transposase [Neptuniibacter sp. QD34_54]|uniref:IS3 family transposase n=1 Tax=Neptuniibacter sp. QD34_54 TaxID=3398208 RepID=UPI0039F63912